MNNIKKFFMLFLVLYSTNIMQAACCNAGCNCTNQMFTCATTFESILYTTNANGTTANKVICPSTICPLCKHAATDHNCPVGQQDLTKVYSAYPIIQSNCGTCTPSTTATTANKK